MSMGNLSVHKKSGCSIRTREFRKLIGAEKVYRNSGRTLEVHLELKNIILISVGSFVVPMFLSSN